MDIGARLQQLEELINEAKSMPLSSSVLVNRDEVLEIIASARKELPEEIKQARWVVKDREQLLAKARKDGEQIVQRAGVERARLLGQQEIVRAAKEEAERLLAEGREQSRQLRLEAEDYVDAKLAQFEIALRKILEDAQGTARSLAKTLDQVEVGRDRLRSPTTVAEQELAPPDLRAEPSALFDAEEGGEAFADGEGLR